MVQIFIALFVIFITTEQRSVCSINENDFTKVHYVLSFGNRLFRNRMAYLRGVDNQLMNATDVTVAKLREISLEFDEILNSINQMHIEISHVNKDNPGDNILPLSETQALNGFMNIVDDFYTRAQNIFKTESTYTDDSLTLFSRKVFLASPNIPITLKKIHYLIFLSMQYNKPGILNDVINSALINLPHVCDKYKSAQQRMFHLYINLMFIHIKAFAVVSYATSTIHRINGGDHTDTLVFAKENFDKRIINYHNEIQKAMVLLPKEIHRCEMNIPKRDINFIEFVKYHRAILYLSGDLDLRSKSNCQVKCENIDYTSSKHLTHLKMESCRTVDLSSDIDVCLAEPNTHRRYIWWRNRGRIRGHNEKCVGKMNYGKKDRPGVLCNMCLCSVIDTLSQYKNHILRISVASQISDIKNNMVVVGVKFVVHDKTVYLQIKQSQINFDKLINNSTEWKRLDDNKSNNHLQYVALADYSGQIYLDDVTIPPKYAVTGVRFSTRNTYPEGFYMQVHGTAFNMDTGELDPESSAWFTAGDWGFNPMPHYKRNRIEIQMNDPDDPSRCSGYNYDRKANKFIKLHHSSVDKDAGQSTVPYLDAQPVETDPAFPLSGIGLFYRNKEGCGGYIAPRIFTIDITPYM